MADFFTNLGKGFTGLFAPQQQSSGLTPADRQRFSAYLGDSTPQRMTTLWETAQRPYQLPLGMPEVDEPTGLLKPQRAAFDEAVKQAFSRASGASALAGQLRPDNLSAVAGSAVQNVLPQFAPLIQEVSQYRQGLSQVPETVFQQRMQQYLASLNAAPGLLGSQGTGAGLGYNALGAWMGAARSTSNTTNYFGQFDQVV